MSEYDNQSDDTKRMFESVWGDNAKGQWEKEHGAEVAKKSKKKGSKGSGAQQDSSGLRDAFTQAAGSDERTAKSNQKSSQTIARMNNDNVIKAANIRAGVDREQIGANLQIAANQLGWDKEKFPQLLAQEQAKIEQAREQLERIGIPAQELEKWKAEKNYELAQAAHELETKRVEAGIDAEKQRIGIERQNVLGGQAIQRGQLGSNLFTTLANLNNAGAAKAFQYAAAADQARQSPDAQSWLQSLYAQTRPGMSLGPQTVSPVSGDTIWGDAMGTAPGGWATRGIDGGGVPTFNPQTGQYEMAAAPGAAVGPGTAGGISPEQRQAILAGMQNVFTAPNQLGPQYMAQRKPTEAGLLQSGAEASGYNWDDVVDQYKKAAIGQ
jgi:hypothetical protein